MVNVQSAPKRVLLRVAVVFVLSGCAEPAEESLPRYHGQSYEDVTAEHGQPNGIGEFMLTDSTKLYEYQSSLYRFREGDGALAVRQGTWTQGQGRHRQLVVWFGWKSGRWIGLEGLRWDTVAAAF